MVKDGPGPAWERYQPPNVPRPERVAPPDVQPYDPPECPEPAHGRRPRPPRDPRLPRRAVLAAGGAIALVALGTVVASHHHARPAAPESIISEQGYADLLTALRAGPGTEVTGIYLSADFAQVHLLKDAARDEMWTYSPSEGLRIQSASRAVDAQKPFDAAGFDGARLADACVEAAREVESTAEHCTVNIAPVDRMAHPSWVEVIFGSYTAYYDRAVRPTFPDVS